MSRRKISEYRAKQLVFDKLGQDYEGIAIDIKQADWQAKVDVLPAAQYVCKVDQGIKKRGKQGLIFVGVEKSDIPLRLKELADKGFQYFLVEPMVVHEQAEERYVALQRNADGSISLLTSEQGGVDIEENTDSVNSQVISSSEQTNNHFFRSLYELFINSHSALLEINPYVENGDGVMPLDVAMLVDDAAEFFVDSMWSSDDFRDVAAAKSPEEQAVLELNSRSPASLNLKVLNPEGSLFLLMSGGGASVVVLDELVSLGVFEQVANYGEYSGNPNRAETALYTTQLLSLIDKSSSGRKVLLIAGGIANFTDVSKTFDGIIDAMTESDVLTRKKVSVIVRRGGPNADKGLAKMSVFLSKLGVDSEVYGAETALSEAVRVAAERLER